MQILRFYLAGQRYPLVFSHEHDICLIILFPETFCLAWSALTNHMMGGYIPQPGNQQFLRASLKINNSSSQPPTVMNVAFSTFKYLLSHKEYGFNMVTLYPA